MSDSQRVPVDASETDTFTPDILKDLPNAPTFTLKATTWRQREAMEYAIEAAGLRRYHDEEVREITVEELCRLWQCDEQSEMIRRVKAYWEAIDDAVEEASNHALETEAAKEAGEEPPEPLPPFEHPDAEEMGDLMRRLTEASERIRKMGVANLRYRREIPRYNIAHALLGWTGLKTVPSFEAGVISIDSVMDLRKELMETFGAEVGAVAFDQVAIRSLKRIYLLPDTEKNSESPAPSASTPAPTKENGQASTNGKSPESEPSGETPESSSPPETSN
jgi:hypothetical protein